MDARVFLFFMGLFVVCGGLYGCPRYFVYTAELEGQAVLAKSLNERKAQVEDARGRMESSKLLAEAEVERAKGVAKANEIIGDSLKGNESYLRYLYLNNLEKAERGGTVIYVPTEAGMPILEAGKRP